MSTFLIHQLSEKGNQAEISDLKRIPNRFILDRPMNLFHFSKPQLQIFEASENKNHDQGGKRF